MKRGSEFHGGPRSERAEPEARGPERNERAEPEARGPERNARRGVRRVSTTAIFFRFRVAGSL